MEILNCYAGFNVGDLTDRYSDPEEIECIKISHQYIHVFRVHRRDYPSDADGVSGHCGKFRDCCNPICDLCSPLKLENISLPKITLGSW